MGKGESEMRLWGNISSSSAIVLSILTIIISSIAMANETGVTNISVKNNTITISSIGIVVSIVVIILSAFAIKKILFAHQLYINAQTHFNQSRNQPVIANQGQMPDTINQGATVNNPQGNTSQNQNESTNQNDDLGFF
jgi:uncharacterized membrane protein YcgQ (UPF0703/DUF1980 family)